ncbi:hypothetical protein IV102_13480 [bacterium]|nr:hypothetical protein [bacterium]
MHNQRLGISLLAALALFTAACGSSTSTVTGVPGAQANASQFAGQFLGTNNLNGGQTGAVDLQVDPFGRITGVLRVVAAPVTPAGILLPVGSYLVSGTINPQTGSFSVSGSLPGLSDFTLVGTVPTGTDQGSYVLTIGGETFTGVLQSAGLGMPGPSPSPGQGTNRLVGGGTLSGFIFSPLGGYNGVNPPVNTASLIGGVVRDGSNNNNTATISISQSQIVGTSVTIRALVVGVVTGASPLTVGQTYPLVSTPNGEGSLISLSETTGTTIDRAWAPTPNSAGNVTITSLTDTSIQLDFQFTNLGPNSEAPGTAAGGFDTSGTVVGNFVQLP